MKKKTIVITGGSDGIGKAAARILKSHGHEVIITGRSEKKTMAVAKELGLKYYIADFSKLNNVRELAAKLNSDIKKIDVLANNAGGIMSERRITEDGNELTLQVNHLAPFLLTELLIEKLIKSKAVVINTSSIANKLLSKFNIDDLSLDEGYSSTRAYGNAKLANILFTTELDRRYARNGLASAAFHPGNVATSFSKDSSSLFMKIVYRTPLRKFLSTPEKGADTLVWLAESEAGNDWESGQYYENRKISKATKEAYNTKLAKDLWSKSESAVKQ